MDKKNGCGCNSLNRVKSCCDEDTRSAEKNRPLLLEFFYIDLTTCERCIGTEEILTAAIAEVAPVLRMSGFALEIKKTLVSTEEQARDLRLLSSPTVRVNGQDIQMDVRESQCVACGSICGDEVDCRVWVWRGEEYAVPPKQMLVDGILRAVYGDKHVEEESSFQELPLNLKKFFAAKKNKEND